MPKKPFSLHNAEPIFAIALSANQVQSALWQVRDGQIEVLTKSASHSWKDEKEAVDAVDKSLQELDKLSEYAKQTLFALPAEWTDAEGIVASRKPFFEKLTKELSLEAVGFVVMTEAMVQHIVQQEGQQTHLFFIEVEDAQVKISLVKQGELKQTKIVGSSNDIISDVTEALAHFKDKTFPPKMLVFSSSLPLEELEKVQQQLVSYDWKSKYPFLHPPVVEILPSRQMMEMIVATGGLAIAKAAQLVSPSAAPVSTAFASNELVPAELPTLTAEPQPTSFGVPIPDNPSGPVHGKVLVSTQAPPLNDDFHPPEKHFSSPVLQFFHRKPALLLVIGILLGIGLLFATGFFLAPKFIQNVITVQLKTQAVSKDVEFTLDPSIAQSDPQALLLRAEALKKVVEGEKSASSSGKKIIGDKATGKATIFNRTSSSKTFPTGTTLKKGTIEFTLDSEVTVASASTGTSFETTPGKQEVSVTAKNIGDESNIAKDQDLQVESFAADTYVGRTSTAFTGGSSRETLAVSAKDRDNLLVTLKKELASQAADEFAQSSGNDQYVVPTNRVKVLSATYSAEVGKEVNSFSLKLGLEAEAFRYTASELKNVGKVLLQQDTPPNMQFVDQDLEVLSQPVVAASSATQLKLQTQLKGKVKAQVASDELAQEIAGQTVEVATERLKSKPSISKVSILRQPTFFTWFAPRLPSDPKQIIIRIE